VKDNPARRVIWVRPVKWGAQEIQGCQEIQENERSIAYSSLRTKT
jgi:hypothetical protein